MLPKCRKLYRKMRISRGKYGWFFYGRFFNTLHVPGDITFFEGFHKRKILGWDYNHSYRRLRVNKGNPVTEEEVIEDVKNVTKRLAVMLGR